MPNYTVPKKRRSDFNPICPRCCERPKAITANGKPHSLCRECHKQVERDRRLAYKESGYKESGKQPAPSTHKPYKPARARPDKLYRYCICCCDSRVIDLFEGDSQICNICEYDFDPAYYEHQHPATIHDYRVEKGLK